MANRSVGAMGAPDAWAGAALDLGLDPTRTADRAVQLLRDTPAAISDTIDGLSAEDRASRTLVPLHRSAQALSDKILKGLQPLGR